MLSEFDSDIKDEIKSLRNALDSNEPELRKNAVKRTLSLVRSGENVASLFASMLRCVHTEDVQLKKLVYLYLVTYSSQEPEQSIMVVNTFVQDSKDPSPIVRALAVRTMCRIKLDTVAEYMIVPLKDCLQDKDAYVRKTAAIAVAKLYEVIPETVENSQILSKLESLLNDENPMVVSNTTAALFEINDNRTTPFFVLNEKNVTPVLSAMTQCSGWVQTMLLDALSKYSPATDSEASFLIDRLVPFMKHSNPAVVIGAFKCIYIFMEIDKRSTVDIFSLIIPPFITLVSSGEPEIQFIVLRALSLFVMKYPKALQKETRIFFCKYNDPCYVKLEKLDIIVNICTTLNVQMVINELEEYCNDIDVAFVRKSIQCLGQIAMKVQVSARRCVDILVKLVEGKAEYAVEATIEVFTDILRVFPGEFESVISKVCQNVEVIKEPKAKAAAIWIIGEYCHLIEKVDLLIDPFLDTFGDEPPEVQTQILTTVVKVFLTKPENSKDQLQFLLEEATKENVSPDIRNRALIYWRFMTLDKDSARNAVIFNKSDNITQVSQRFDAAVLDELIRNMGTVSGTLHVVPKDFVKNQLYLPEEEINDDDNGYNDKSHEWQKVPIANDEGIIDIFIDWEPSKLWVKVVNKSQNTLSQFAIALNKNCIGIDISEQPSFPDHLEFGESFEICIPIKHTETCVSTLESSLLQIALRTNLGNLMFSVPIDFTCMTKQIENINAGQFNTLWNQPLNTSNNAEIFITVTDATIADVAILSGRGVLKIEGMHPSELYVAFSLPPALFYMANIRQLGPNVQITLRGNICLFPVIKQNAMKLFCVENTNNASLI